MLISKSAHYIYMQMKHIDTKIAENAHKLGTRLELQNYDATGAPLSWGRATYTTAFFTPACSIHRSSVPVAAGEVRRSPSPECACWRVTNSQFSRVKESGAVSHAASEAVVREVESNVFLWVPRSLMSLRRWEHVVELQRTAYCE